MNFAGVDNRMKMSRKGELGLERPFISISGLIGAGKTTLADALGEKLGLPVYHEPVQDNEYLQDFYGDIAKYGFAMQIYLLNRRFEQQQQIIWFGKGGIQDRTVRRQAGRSEPTMGWGIEETNIPLLRIMLIDL
jgi:hypothetical protein